MAKPKRETMLASVPLFEGLTKRHLKKVSKLVSVVDFTAGDVIVQQGHAGDSLYIALTGQAKVAANGRTVHRVLPGDHFGEISVLDGGPRTASVVAETPMTLLMVTRGPFMRELAHDPELTIALLESLARTIRRVDRSLAR